MVVLSQTNCVTQNAFARAANHELFAAGRARCPHRAARIRFATQTVRRGRDTAPYRTDLRAHARVGTSREGPGKLSSRVFLFLAILLLTSLVCGCDTRPGVVVYTSQDQVYAQPIFQAFEQKTGIRVRAVFDSEAVKTVGLANRLLAEQRHPQCDIFWGNEEFRTRQLAASGLFRASNGWVAVGHRSRRIVINTNLVMLESAPRSLVELTNPVWRGKVVLAYPLFGTTATHCLALRQAWGPTSWEHWCRALVNNQCLLVDGNSVVVQLVGRGEAGLGLTDSDDIAAGQRQGLPIVALPLTAETLLIPNTIAAIRNGPHPEQAQQLFDHLQSPETVQQLVRVQALESISPSAPTSAGPTLAPDWNALLLELEPATKTLQKIFLR
jgi:iron(III) transport system substrate-binding protein